MDQETLEEIWREADAVKEATVRLRTVVARAAAQPGANVSAIADAAGVTRQTVYRWRDDDERPVAAEDLPAVLDEALLALLATGAGPAHELHAGLGTPNRAAKARRVLLVAGNLSPSHQVTEELRAAIEAGCAAANQVLAGPRRAVA